MSYQGHERREYVRIPAEYEVICYRFAFGQGSGTSKVVGRAKDMSATGLLFESNKAYEKGDVLKISINIPDWKKFDSGFYNPNEVIKKEPLMVLGSVVRIEEIPSEIEGEQLFKIAVHFASIDQGHKEILKKFIEHIAKEK